MKHIIHYLILGILPLNSIAQHICSSAKTSSNQHSQAVPINHVNLENKYDARFHVLDLSIERTNKNVSGSVRTLATVIASSLDTFTFELYNTLIIDSVRLNGILINPIRVQDAVSIPLATPLSQGNTIDATIYYHGTAPTINGAAIGDGLNNRTSPTWGNQVTYSLSQPYSAYEWWPCKQQLQDKLDSVYVIVTTDSSNKAGSNGLLKSVTTIGSKKRFEWHEINPINYYLISVSVARYIEYNLYAHPLGTMDSVFIQNYIYNNPATLPNFQSVIDQTDDMIELFSNLFGLYPFINEKYGHCMAPLGGGMEHQTMTTLGSFSFGLVAHELGHQWWGDFVTCRTWNDIFINEGFASYSEQLALEFLDPANAAANMNSIHSSVKSQADGSVYNPDTTSVGRIFDSRLSYDKGAAMIHTLRFEIDNDSLFFAGLRNFLQAYQNANASISDFKLSIENTTGMNFTQFFSQWIYGEGFPTFTVKWNQIGNQFILKNTETVSYSSVTPLFITPIEYKLVRSSGGDTIIKLQQGQSIENYVLTVNGTVTSVVIDPDNWIVNNGSASKDLTLVGIEETEMASGIKLFPNPANDFLTINTPLESGISCAIFDFQGRSIAKKTLGLHSSLNISEFENGIYFIRFFNAEGICIHVKKFIKA